MSASDKARFYLEQSVPELKEYERKKIFTTDEIRAIAKKRSDFEHKINARGSSTTDFARYAEFEINVDALRRKRGIRVPEDVLVAGFDDIPAAAWGAYDLTTVVQDARAMVEQSFTIQSMARALSVVYAGVRDEESLVRQQLVGSV